MLTFALLCVAPAAAFAPATSNAHVLPNAATCLACARTWFPSEETFFHSPEGGMEKGT